MGIFGRSSMNQATMFGSAAMTYGHAVNSLVRSGSATPEQARWLAVCLRHAVYSVGLRMGGTDPVMALFDDFFAVGGIEVDELQLLGEDVGAGFEDEMDDLCGLLNMRFQKPISREEAVDFGVRVTGRFVDRATGRLSPQYADLCGFGIALALKSIQDDTRDGPRKEREGRILMGCIVGSWWAAKALEA